MVPGTPFDSARVEALLEARGAKTQPGGGRAWQLEHGSVEVHPLREGGQWVATEVRVPLADQDERTARYAGELLGLASAMPMPTAPDEGFQPATKFFFGALGFFTLLYLLVNWLNTQLGG